MHLARPFLAAVLCFSAGVSSDTPPTFFDAVLSETSESLQSSWPASLPSEWRQLIDSWDDVRPHAEFCLGTQREAEYTLSRTIPDPLPTDASDPICASETAVTAFLCSRADILEYYDVSCLLGLDLNFAASHRCFVWKLSEARPLPTLSAIL
jgi:hypothetical protein